MTSKRMYALGSITITVFLASCGTLHRSSGICGNDGTFTFDDEVSTKVVSTMPRATIPSLYLATKKHVIFVGLKDFLSTLERSSPGADLNVLRNAVTDDFSLDRDADILAVSSDSPALTRRAMWIFAELLENGKASVIRTANSKNMDTAELAQIVVTRLDGHGQFRTFCEPPNIQFFEFADALE